MSSISLPSRIPGQILVEVLGRNPWVRIRGRTLKRHCRVRVLASTYQRGTTRSITTNGVFERWSRTLGELGKTSALERGLVGRNVHQVGRSAVVRDDLEEPAVAVRVCVDQLGSGVECLVARHDLATQRCIDLADRLGGLE